MTRPRTLTTSPLPPLLNAVPLLAGFDTITYSSRARISQEVRAQLAKEKEAAQVAVKAGAVHCPKWLGARVLPSGGRGASFLLETEDFTIKIMGEHMETWPGLCVELRSFSLHTHEEGAQGAIEASLAWIREHLLADQDAKLVEKVCSFETVTPSRFDLHIDWQGGFAPSFAAGEVERFVKPRRLKWHPFFEGTRCTGYRFGSGDPILARLYNKSTERRARHDEGYFALLAARDPVVFDPNRDVWRLEFQIRREGLTSFRLAPSTAADEKKEGEDLEAQIEAELSAEDVPHLATFPKLFEHREALFQHLTTYWLRLTIPGGGSIPSRWPTDPTWEALRRDFGRLAGAPPLNEQARELVRAFRYEGRQRLLRRMVLAVINALEVQDASVASASLRQLAELIARKEERRLQARKEAVLKHDGAVPPWVVAGMGTAIERQAKVRHLIQMLLGIFAAHGVLALGDKPIHSVGDLLTQHLDLLEAIAEDKGGVSQVLRGHFAKVYKRALPPELADIAQ
ncbi:MAG: hypothetical protein ACLQUY_09360 [Ktedonobacterales bacterium]